MKKIISKKAISCMLILVVLLSATAHAQAPSLSENLFKYAKSALKSLAAGDYQKVVTSLPFSGVSPSAKEWSSFVEGSFGSLSGDAPQTKYAVAYWTGKVWKVAVPLAEPDSKDVETFVLVSEDGSSFSGYGCSSWGNVSKEYQKSDYVRWNDEYNGSTSVVVEFDAD